jgi:hypothetical protein
MEGSVKAHDSGAPKRKAFSVNAERPSRFDLRRFDRLDIEKPKVVIGTAGRGEKEGA